MIEIIVSLLILSDGESMILLRKNKNGTFSLPWIKVRFGNTAEESLTQYVVDKYGFSPKNLYFLGAVEHIKNNAEPRHQYNLVFKVIDHNKRPMIPHDGLEYEWEHTNLADQKFEPSYLKKDIQRWLKGDELFFTSKNKIYYN